MAPPEERFVPRFAAEPPQEDLPYGRWAQRLEEELRAVWSGLDAEGGEIGEPGTIAWYPDRTWHGRTYVPATSITSNGYELYGYVRFVPGGENSASPPIAGGGRGGGVAPSEFSAQGDFTDETAERNPQWRIDICDEVIGSWRGQGGKSASMTLVWGRPLVGGGWIATAELGGVTVDQCELIDQRFTLIAPDDYRHDLLKIRLWGAKGQELACESLYEGQEGEEDPTP